VVASKTIAPHGSAQSLHRIWQSLTLLTLITTTKTMIQQSTNTEILDEIVTGIFDLIGSTNKLNMMIGAHSFCKGHFDNPGIQFKFPTSNKINCCQLTLDINSDLYHIKFMQIVDFKVTDRGTHADVYVENVREIFESSTGLYLSLWVFGGVRPRLSRLGF
jgi:hypothetical protein